MTWKTTGMMYSSVVLSTSGQHILSRSAGLGFRRLAGSAGSRVGRIEGRLGFGLSAGPDVLGVGQGKQAGQGQGGQGVEGSSSQAGRAIYPPFQR